MLVPASTLVPELPCVTVEAPLITPAALCERMPVPLVEIAPPPVSEPVRLSVPPETLIAPPPVSEPVRLSVPAVMLVAPV